MGNIKFNNFFKRYKLNTLKFRVQPAICTRNLRRPRILMWTVNQVIIICVISQHALLKKFALTDQKYMFSTSPVINLYFSELICGSSCIESTVINESSRKIKQKNQKTNKCCNANSWHYKAICGIENQKWLQCTPRYTEVILWYRP